MSESAGEKTEAPTPKRKRKAAEDGQLLKSKEYGTALIILAGAIWLGFFGQSLLSACQSVMTASFSFERSDIETFEPWRPLASAGWKLFFPIGSLFAIAVIGALISQASLGSFHWNNKLLKPKASRMDPAKGLKRIFGPTGLIELGKSLLKVVLIGSMGGWMLWNLSTEATGLVRMDFPAAVGALGGKFIFLMFLMATGMVIIAGVDLPIQIIRHIMKLRMSKQEVKDEHKQTEGSPELKGALRQRQREIMKGGFRTAMAEADVVLTNPTHFSVALRYKPGQDQVPVVIAKGRGQTALAIRELARDMDVPMLEYPTLARAVYFTSREGQEVRDDLYLAIATVLAFVFGANQQAGGRMPSITVPESARFDENGQKAAGTS